MNFFERMERKIDFDKEYKKIEDIVLNERDYHHPTIEEEIATNFRKWKDRGNFMSFKELREHLGFEYHNDAIKYIPIKNVVTVEDFLVYCEMLSNMFYNVIGPQYKSSYNADRINHIADTINCDLDSINYELRLQKDNRIIAVQKDATVSAVLDLVEPNLADLIVEFNHHTLNGDLDKKRDILSNIAYALEPKRKELEKVNRTVEDDLFYLINKMNIRHNNCDKEDEKKYCSTFTNLSNDKKEEWYDLIYQEGLMAFLLLEQEKRNKIVKDFKQQTETRGNN